MPLLCLVVVALLAKGDDRYTPLVLVPVFWLALYGSRSAPAAGIIGTALTCAYAETEWRQVVVGVVASGLVGWAVQRLTAERRAHADTGEALRTAMLASSLDGVVAMDHTGRVLEFNPAAERTFGYARAEAVGSDLGTESVLMQEVEMLHALKAVGVSLALDDFGTGYSSLGYLRRFPLDVLKLDRAFVSELGADEAADSIIAAVIEMARALGMQVIAEGVETASQLATLQALGCDLAQGFHIARPLPPSQLAAVVAAS